VWAKVVLFLADNTGHLFSAKKIGDFLRSNKIDIATSQIINYINYLANTFLIKRVRRMDIAGKKIFEFGEKFYFQDLGLRHSLLGFRQADIGKILENVVYNNLLISGYEIKVG
jgi:predicted AAA+ superfamily ATPase